MVASRDIDRCIERVTHCNLASTIASESGLRTLSGGLSEMATGLGSILRMVVTVVVSFLSDCGRCESMSSMCCSVR